VTSAKSGCNINLQSKGNGKKNRPVSRPKPHDVGQGMVDQNDVGKFGRVCLADA